MFAGVAAGVVLPVLNKDGCDAACVPVLPAFPKRLGCEEAVLFASFDAGLLPILNRLPPLAGVCAGVELAAPPPNKPVAGEDEAGFAPPKSPDEGAPAPALLWVF